jgi:hypothetical protein
MKWPSMAVSQRHVPAYSQTCLLCSLRTHIVRQQIVCRALLPVWRCSVQLELQVECVP